jgi:Zn-dependent M28 family amino/carboxypeptidase
MDVRYEVVSERTAPNTVGILEGSDPVLKDEYVVFSAHMDHVGVGNPVNGDSIYNGADDDASGTIGVVELSEAFAALHPRPRRSMIFLTVSGEEKGLWGSDWFARHPPVPIGQIVADLNADMIGRNWRDTIVVIGKEHSDLGATLERVNAAHPELGMTAIDDIWPEEGFYRRSDHFNFARRGVPVLFFFNGTHPDYHQPSDHPDKIDAEKEARIVKLMFYLGLEIANATERPKWNPDSYKDIVSEGR